MARIIEPFKQFFDGDGDPLIDGWLKFTESGTNLTDKDTFADVNLEIANTNPLQLDSEGRCPSVFGTGSYRVTLYTDDGGSPGIQIDQKDPVSGASGTFSIGDWNSLTNYDTNSIIQYDGSFYLSRIDGNIGNIPDTSPTQWEQIDFTHIYNADIVYAEDDWVIDPVNGYFYISLVASNQGNTPNSSPTKWKDQVELNRVDIADHETRITQNETDIADHETRITQNETDISDLQSDKMDKSQNLNDVANKATSRTNLDVYSKSETDNLISDATLPIGSLIEHYGDNPDDSIYVVSASTVSLSAYPLIETILPPALSFTENVVGGLSGAGYGGSYDGTYYVSVGAVGEIETATDPAGTWTAQTSGTSENLNSIIYDGTYHIAVGAAGTILTATDPTGTWTSRTSGTSENLNDIVTDGTNYVICGNNAKILTATDPTGTWTSRTAAGSYTDDFDSAAYGDGYFVITGRLGEVQTSATNGVSWVQNTSGSSATVTESGAYSDGHFVFGTNGGEVLKATDPTGTWTIDSTTYSGADVDVVVFGDGFFAFGVDDGKIGVSNSSAVAITAAADTVTSTPSAIIIGGDLCVVLCTNGVVFTAPTTTRQVPTFSTSQTGFIQYMRIA